MKKTIFILTLTLLLISGCSGNGKSGVLSEKDNIYNPAANNPSGATERIIDLKNGATPKVKPTGKTTNENADAQAQSQTQAQTTTASNQSMQLENLAATYKYAVLKTNQGDIKLAFYPDDASVTVNNFMNLAKKEFYNGTKFHRVIKDFMIQGGDPLTKDDSAQAAWGTGGPGYKFQDEFNSHQLVKGSLAMANSGANTNGSQFFIVTKESTPWLDGKHTNFGEVVEGMDIVMKIEGVAVDENDRPTEPVIINSVELLTE